MAQDRSPSLAQQRRRQKESSSDICRHERCDACDHDQDLDGDHGLDWVKHVGYRVCSSCCASAEKLDHALLPMREIFAQKPEMASMIHPECACKLESSKQPSPASSTVAHLARFGSYRIVYLFLLPRRPHSVLPTGNIAYYSTCSSKILQGHP